MAISRKISNSEFIRMCVHGSINEIEEAIKSGVNVNYKDKAGVTPLMIVSGFNSAEVVKLLLNSGADVNAVDEKGMTALMFASLHNTVDVVKVLIKAGADVNAVNKDRYTALVLAAELNAPQRAMRTITFDEAEDTVCFNYETFKEAEKNAFEITKALLEAGANPKYKDKGGYSVLMAASKTASAEIIKALIEAGADVNARTKGGLTALIIAARYNPYSDVVKIMLDAGANASIKDRAGKTAADYVRENEERFLKALKS